MSRLKHFFVTVLAGLPALAASCMSAQAATYTPQEQANIKLVVDYDATLAQGEADHDLKLKIRSIAQQYLSADYIRHADDVPIYGQGQEDFIRRIQQKDPPPALPEKVLALMAHGDLVVRISSRSMPGNDSSAIYIFNMLRIQDGKVVEQWEAASDNLKMLGGGAGNPAGK